MLITIMQHWAESITSRFCRRKTNTLSRFSLRAATISLFRGVESPSGNVWISSERRRKISSTSSTWVGLAKESERNENVDWNNDNHTKQLCIQNGQWPAIISNTGFAVSFLYLNMALCLDDYWMYCQMRYAQHKLFFFAYSTLYM